MTPYSSGTGSRARVRRLYRLSGFCESGKGIWHVARIWGVELKRDDFAAFYAGAKDECLRIVLASVGDRELAEDLVAEAFTRAWSSWRKVRAHPAPKAWVVRTALNTSVSWWRRRRWEVPVDDIPQLAGPAHTGGVDDALVAAIRGLPARQREVIVLRVFFDLDTAATAELLGVAIGTVGAHLHRGLAALRAQIPSSDDQEHGYERR
jgi:RNA polymerase sigma-70 factor (sigma-E family)